MATIKSTDENFDTLIKENKFLICDFWASWCGPCLQIAPHLESLSEELKDKCVITKHNIDEEPNCPTKYGVRGIPTLMFFKEGKLIDTKVGSLPKSSLEAWLQDNL